MPEKKRRLREYALLDHEVYVLDFTEAVIDYINNDFFKENLSWSTIIFFRITPWMLGNILFAWCTLPILLWFVRLLFNFWKYTEFYL